MTPALQQRGRHPIYALSGFPHPDAPPIAAGETAAIEAEDARIPPRGPAPPASPSRRRFRISAQHEFLQIFHVAVEGTPKRARLPPKIREELR